MTDQRLLVLMGSGETTPTMVTIHQRLVEAARPAPGAAPSAGLFDTPYGFQENADDLNDKTLGYFAHNVGVEVDVVTMRRASEASGLDLERANAAVRELDWVFAGPGSPTYLLRQWRETDLPQLFADRVAGRSPARGVTIFASAAAVIVGSHAIPVYEIYKVGADPEWVPGLDLLAEIGLGCVVIPHYDNAEGGGHDTRFCYLGERRLSALEDDLDEAEWILGIDEHTATIIDPVARTVEIVGRGGITVRRQGRSATFAPSTTVAFDEILAAVAALGDADGSAPSTDAALAVPADVATIDVADGSGDATPYGAEITRIEVAFDAALTGGDLAAATAAALDLERAVRDWAADSNTSGDDARATRLLRSMITRLGRLAEAGAHDHAELLAPPVELLLDLRRQARAAKDFALGDRIRDTLVDAAIEVRDTPDGSVWEFTGD